MPGKSVDGKPRTCDCCYMKDPDGVPGFSVNPGRCSQLRCLLGGGRSHSVTLSLSKGQEEMLIILIDSAISLYIYYCVYIL